MKIKIYIYSCMMYVFYVQWTEKIHLTQVSKCIQGLPGEEVNGGEFPEQPPPRAIGGEHQVLVVIGYVFGSGVRRPAAEIRVMNFQKLFRHRRRRRHYHVHESETQVHQRAMNLGQGGKGVVRNRAHVREIAHNGPGFWAWREWQRRGTR